MNHTVNMPGTVVFIKARNIKSVTVPSAVKKYKKIFTKANAGRKVAVK